MTTEQRIKALDIRMYRFERMLSEQVYQLRCGKIIDSINHALGMIPNPRYVTLSPSIYMKIMPYVTRLDVKVDLIMSVWLNDNSFLIS